MRGRHEVLQPLELRLADVGEPYAVGAGGRARVEVHRQRVALRDRVAEAARDQDALLHRRSGERHEWDDVHRADARVLASVGP